LVSERAGHAATNYNPLIESCKVNEVKPLAPATGVRSEAVVLPTPNEFAELGTGSAHPGSCPKATLALISGLRHVVFTNRWGEQMCGASGRSSCCTGGLLILMGTIPT